MVDTLDKVDTTILKKLSSNSRSTCSEISELVGVATSTIHNRMRRLEENGTIECFTIVPDPTKVGQNITSYVGINIELDKKDKVIDKVKKIDDVLELYELLEPYDLFIKVRTENIETLKERVLRVISNIDGVLDMSNILTTKRHKEVTCSMPDYKFKL